MLIYITYYFLIGISSFLIPKIQKNRYKIVQFVILCSGLCLILALRHPSMGADLGYGETNGYLSRFKQIASLNWDSIFRNDVYGLTNYEVGYKVFNKLISLFGSEYQCLLIFTALVSIIPVFYIFMKYSESFESSIIIYLGLTCFLALFSALRQACAISICCFSYKFIKEKKIIPFVIMVLLGFTFHSSAILFLLAYPCYYLKIKKNIRFLTLGLIFAVFLFRTQLFNLFVGLIGKNYVVNETGAINFYLFLIGIYILLVVFSKEDRDLNGLLNLLLLLIICQGFGNIHPFVARLGYYFMPFLCIAIPNSFSKMEKVTGMVIKYAFLCFFLAYGVFSIYSSRLSWAQAYPWTPFWNK